MVEGEFLYAPEPGAFLLSVLDELTNPRRGGPRFVKEEDRVRIDAIAKDRRSTERLAADGFLELLRIGSDADPTGHRPGARRTTSTSGNEITAEPTSRTGYCCCSTTTAGTSPAWAAATR